MLELLNHVCVQKSYFDVRPNRLSWQPSELESIDKSNVESKRYDIRRAASYVLYLFNKGAIGRATFLPEDEEEASKYFVLET